ncbi:MAG: hypothetical protein KDE58_29295 [Caldilineaceae bacterium]|nr:hypothetical protein [Caldilineaceae bacterium]
MGTGQLEVVADAGPLIHLAEIKQITLLEIFDAIHIPDAVWQETVGQKRISVTDLQVLPNTYRHTFSDHDVADFIRNHHLTHLHTGERACLYLCQKINVFTLLTDDLSVRAAVKQRNWQPVGSLGIIVRAYKVGKISLPDAVQYLNQLYEASTLFVTRAIIDLALQQLR